MDKSMKKNPALDASCSHGLGGVSAAAKERSACAGNDAAILVSHSGDALDVQAGRQECRSLADGEFARLNGMKKLSRGGPTSRVLDVQAGQKFASRPNQQRRHCRGSAPVNCSQEPSGEAASALPDDWDNQMYVNRNIAGGKERRKQQWRKRKLLGKPIRRSTSPVSTAKAASGEASSPAWEKEDQLMAAGRLDTRDAQAVQESSAAPVGKIVKLYRDAFTSQETKTNQQQDEPSQPESHDGSRSSEKEQASSLLVMDTQGTCNADMRVSRIAGDNGEHTNKVASVANNEEERQMESVNWDPYELRNFFDSYIDKLPSTPPDENAESWAKIEELEEPEITKLNERLALCRIRAHELLEEGQARDVEELKTVYSSTALEANAYFDMYEQSFEWYFDTEFCNIGGFQDYQRLVLRNTYAYFKPAMYRETNDTYEVDQEFVKFYEKLEMETKGIVTDLEDRKLQWKGFEALTFLRALKIALGFRKIYKKLFFSSVQFLWSIEFDCTCHNECAQLYFEIWKRVTKQEMDFYHALRQIHEQNICPMFSVLMEPELKYKETPKNHSPKPASIKDTYDTFMAEIPADAPEHLAQQLIMDAVKKIVPKKKTYYDYTKKKLEVAEKIQLIPCERKVMEGIQHRLHLELVPRRGPVPPGCAVLWRNRIDEAGQEEEI